MKFTIVILAIAFALRAAGDDGVRLTMRFDNAPVEQVASFYSDLTGNRVAIEPGVHAKVTLITQEEVTKEGAVRLIKEALLQQNVGIFPPVTNTLVLRWAAPVIRPHRASGGLPTTVTDLSGTATNGLPRMSYQARREERDRARLASKRLPHPTNAVYEAGTEENPKVPENAARKLADPQY